MILFKIYKLVLIIIIIKVINSNKCGADKLDIKPKLLNITRKIKTSVTSTAGSDSYTPIAIGYDFTTLKKPKSMDESVFSNVKSVLQETRIEFSKILQIKHRNIDLTEDLDYIIESCELDTISQDYPNFLIKNDLIIFPMFHSLDQGVLAAAAPCIIGDKYRPYAGVLFINNNLDFGKTNVKLYMKNLLLHEITHILAFHPYFFEKLNMTKKEDSISYIISKNVIAKAKEHFGCSSLTQIALENQGGQGSIGAHWESRYMLGDYMVSTDYPEVAMSDITLALIEDTGFYKVNYYSGGLFKFGKNKGCNFFNKKCIENEKASFDEFCNISKEPKCSSSRTLKSSCFITNYNNLPSQYQYFLDNTKGGYPSTNYCPVPFEYHSTDYYFSNHCQVGTSNLFSEYGEFIGKNSLCFMSSLLPENVGIEANSKIPICYSVECDLNKKSIIVIIGSKRIICPNNGGILSEPSGFKGSIECPKFSEICSTNDGLICNEMFSCFTELAKRDNYSYETSYYDYEGPSSEINLNNQINDDDHYDDDYINPISRTESYNIKTNLVLVFFFLFMFIN